MTALQIGPEFRPSARYLDGWLIGLYPGAAIIHDKVSQVIAFVMLGEAGYQWVWNSGFTLSITAGAYYMPSVLLPNLDIGPGWAFLRQIAVVIKKEVT